MGYDQESGQAWGFLINTPHKTPALARKNLIVQDFQVSIDQRSHGFLRYDSHINCFSFQELDFTDMVNALIASPSKICGSLSADTLAAVIEKSDTNPAFSECERDVLTGPMNLPPF